MKCVQCGKRSPRVACPFCSKMPLCFKCVCTCRPVKPKVGFKAKPAKKGGERGK